MHVFFCSLSKLSRKNLMAHVPSRNWLTLLKTLTEIRTKSDTSRTCGLVFYKKNLEYRSFRLLIFLVTQYNVLVPVFNIPVSQLSLFCCLFAIWFLIISNYNSSRGIHRFYRWPVKCSCERTLCPYTVRKKWKKIENSMRICWWVGVKVVYRWHLNDF